MPEWKKTMCILCHTNCGLEVQTDDDGHIAKVKGDRAHPASQGYLCEKAQGLDRYQNGPHRLDTPLRRRADGTFEAVDWDTAIREVAAKLKEISETHGGETIFYHGGGGQGNHLGGAGGDLTRAALGSVHRSNALAQEKTGEFWVNGNLFGKADCYVHGEFDHAEVSIFLGKNPWQSHGVQRARAVIREIASDPDRSLIVIDPRRTESAEKADYHLAVRPGTDAFLLSAMLAVLIEEDLVDHEFLDARTTGFESVRVELEQIPIGEYADRCGVPEATIRAVARRIAGASSVSSYEDLGIQMSRHSTLTSYLNKLLCLLTGNFAKKGAMNMLAKIFPLLGEELETGTTPATGARMLTGLVPCNSIAEEILSGHKDAWRAMIVESSNPAHSFADSAMMRRALESLEFLVVIDVAMTETARLADYVLPASSQYEKWEATGFNTEFPNNFFHLRAPIFKPLPGTLIEPEIHRRIVRELGVFDGVDLSALRDAADASLDAYALAFLTFMSEHPELEQYATLVMYETMAAVLPEGAWATAPIWGMCQLFAQREPDALARAGFDGDTPRPGNALFEAILKERSGVVFSVDRYEDNWGRMRHEDRKIHLAIPELFVHLHALVDDHPGEWRREFPFVLSAGERRSSTANTILRSPDWQKRGRDGGLRVNTDDAKRLGIADGANVRVTTRRGSFVAPVEITDTLQPGHISLPNGHGLIYPGAGGMEQQYGVAPNDFTSYEDRDPIAGTPWHKHVPARVEAA